MNVNVNARFYDYGLGDVLLAVLELEMLKRWEILTGGWLAG